MLGRPPSRTETLAKPYFTTSEVATLCRVHKNTIILAVNLGKIPVSKTPGRHNRIAREDLIAYMKSHGIPLPEGAEAVQPTVVLVVGESADSIRGIHRALPPPRFQVYSAQGPFEAGAAAARLRPAVLLIACDQGRGDWAAAARVAPGAGDGTRPRVIGISDSGEPPAGSRYDAVLARKAPHAARDLLDTVGRLSQ